MPCPRTPREAPETRGSGGLPAGPRRPVHRDLDTGVSPPDPRLTFRNEWRGVQHDGDGAELMPSTIGRVLSRPAHNLPHNGPRPSRVHGSATPTPTLAPRPHRLATSPSYCSVLWVPKAPVTKGTTFECTSTPSRAPASAVANDPFPGSSGMPRRCVAPSWKFGVICTRDAAHRLVRQNSANGRILSPAWTSSPCVEAAFVPSISTDTRRTKAPAATSGCSRSRHEVPSWAEAYGPANTAAQTIVTYLRRPMNPPVLRPSLNTVWPKAFVKARPAPPPRVGLWPHRTNTRTVRCLTRTTPGDVADSQ